ncbi:MAG: MmgE/PrpD family protein [Thermovirgaceae bacterium]
MQTYLTKLTEYYAERGYESIPAEVTKKARRVLADFLSEQAVGYRESGFGKIWNEYVLELGGKEESTVLCVGRKVPAINAAASMGIMGHAIELDDGHRWGTSHPAVAVIPAVLAVAEREGNSFKDILAAIVIGYDVMLRSARAINPSHLKRGFHSTGTCGSLGAAAGCAHLLGLDPEWTAYAISMGGLQSAGLQEMLHDHPGIKTLQPGKAAMAGVLSADLAMRGAKAPRTLYEGVHGWLKAMCAGEYSEDALMGDLGNRWEIMYTYTKLYPTCRHCHAAIDLAREAREKLGFTPDDVEAIRVRTYSLGNAEVGQIRHPRSFEEAMFSMPFSVALALDRGNVTLQDYTEEVLSDGRLQDAAGKVSIEIDPSMDAKYPEERGAWMEVLLKDGRRFEKAVPVAKGEPENPVDDGDYIEKLKAMTAPHYAPEFFEGLWEIAVKREADSVSYGDIINHFGRSIR